MESPKLEQVRGKEVDRYQTKQGSKVDIREGEGERALDLDE